MTSRLNLIGRHAAALTVPPDGAGPGTNGGRAMQSRDAPTTSAMLK